MYYFVTVEKMQNELAQSLNESGIKVGMIHGGLTPRERKTTNETYSEFRFPICYCK